MVGRSLLVVLLGLTDRPRGPVGLPLEGGSIVGSSLVLPGEAESRL